jgi:hypothetical protein
MNIVFNCCTKPAKYVHHAGITAFKGEKPEVEVQSQIKPEKSANDKKVTNPQKKQEENAQAELQLKPQPEKDVVEISTKNKKEQ